MQTADQAYKAGVQKVFVAKKRNGYFVERNGELAIDKNIKQALCWSDEQAARDFFEMAAIDDRNAATIGRTYWLTPVEFRAR